MSEPEGPITVPWLLYLQLSAFLTMQADGFVSVPDYVKREAKELVDKLGDLLQKDADAKS